MLPRPCTKTLLELQSKSMRFRDFIGILLIHLYVFCSPAVLCMLSVGSFYNYSSKSDISLS